ncbi:uncharacterized protein LOC128257152 [Drosophila gunungcola]|uniref:Uncharacterized protein n=1 Tax=Drosophila gunungcola TaxID=103775 RepID=A0A9P9YRB3_9MUSC|nr:uncharacterized protein LOC128257152 [Drosophila gunungcola]KAI8041473.1 hypothetical protein M5D96_005738 [Drosophila gunungcola]
MWNNSSSFVRLASAKMMVAQVKALEEDSEESSLEFHEDCNQSWRAQFRHPRMSELAIGLEFMNISNRPMTSSLGTQDGAIGNSSSSRTELVPLSLRISQLNMLGSDDESQMQHLY